MYSQISIAKQVKQTLPAKLFDWLKNSIGPKKKKTKPNENDTRENDETKHFFFQIKYRNVWWKFVKHMLVDIDGTPFESCFFRNRCISIKRISMESNKSTFAQFADINCFWTLFFRICQSLIYMILQKNVLNLSEI